MMNKIGNIIFIVAVMIAMVVGLTALSQSASEPSTMTSDGGKEIATAGSYMWPEGAIIHKRLNNGWVCVEIDGHHLLVLSRGNSSFGVAVDDCEK